MFLTVQLHLRALWVHLSETQLLPDQPDKYRRRDTARYSVWLVPYRVYRVRGVGMIFCMVGPKSQQVYVLST